MLLILWYRRRLSGRGPLARVGCTFAHTESCSAYGLRVALEARSLLDAVWLILARLRRCGTASLYEQPGGISWGEAFDDCDPADLDARLVTALETEKTRALMHRSAGLVAVRCGRRGDAREHLARAAALSDTSPRPCVRRSPRLARSLRARLHRRLLVLSVASVGLSISLSGVMLWIGLSGIFISALATTATHRRRARRHDNLMVASAFTVPEDPG